MICTNCGSQLPDGVSFCTNCGAAVVSPVADVVMDVQEAAASLESAVQANSEAMQEIEARVEADEQAAASAELFAAQQAEAEAAAVNDADAYDTYQPPSYGQPAAGQGYQPPIDAGQPEAPQGYQPPAAVPFYQQDVSPNAHYSSQRTYEGGVYGQNVGQAGQPGYQANYQTDYQQPSYGQPQAAPAATDAWVEQSMTKRAFAMVLYVSGLLGLIFALLVRDKDDVFITHHLNNNVVIFIGMLISSFLAIIGIGFILAIYLVVMMIIGIVSAYNGDMRELPLIGKIKILK